MEETNVIVTSKLKNLKPQNITCHATSHTSHTSHTTIFKKVTTCKLERDEHHHSHKRGAMLLVDKCLKKFGRDIS
jgi:hypothetical protein